jgi:phosphatidylglycerophosphate synthase
MTTAAYSRAARRVDALVGTPAILLVAGIYGGRAGARCLAGFAGALAVQHGALGLLGRRVAPAPASAAFLLTWARADVGALLAGLVASGVRDRAGPAGWLGWLATLLAATLADWCDGPLARRVGPTALGGALDIEADSWLTLWSCVGAVAWGGLPRGCLVPPLLRYLHPLAAWHSGRLPTGDGACWVRLAGASQMAAIVAALAPWAVPGRARWLRRAALAASGTQGVVQAVQLRHR